MKNKSLPHVNKKSYDKFLLSFYECMRCMELFLLAEYIPLIATSFPLQMQLLFYLFNCCFYPKTKILFTACSYSMHQQPTLHRFSGKIEKPYPFFGGQLIVLSGSHRDIISYLSTPIHILSLIIKAMRQTFFSLQDFLFLKVLA